MESFRGTSTSAALPSFAGPASSTWLRGRKMSRSSEMDHDLLAFYY
jgi:hypothetical protein